MRRIGRVLHIFWATALGESDAGCDVEQVDHLRLEPQPANAADATRASRGAVLESAASASAPAAWSSRRGGEEEEAEKEDEEEAEEDGEEEL